MVTLCMKMVSGRIAAEAAAAPVAVPQMTTPTAPRLSKDEGRAKWLAWTTNKWVEAMASGQKRGPKEDHPQQPWYPPQQGSVVPSAAAAASLKPAAPTRARA